MTKWLMIGPLLLATAAAAAPGGEVDRWRSQRLEPLAGDVARTDTLLYSEDFENGWNGWSGVDLTGIPPVWHPADYISVYAGDHSWWSGLEAIGGYDNQWLQLLQTPVVSIDGDEAQLSFQLYYATEGPAGAPAPYNAWDGCNVWIQVDGGDWEVATGFSLPYTNSSLYSFGNSFNMGPNIPGWCGTNGGWQAVTLDLAEYSGSDVAFRFAFCSDGGFATPDDPSVWGMLVDDVLLTVDGQTVLHNDADGTAIPEDLIPLTGGTAGNTWTISDGSYHSPSHAANATIADGLSCALVSPPILVPTGLDVWLQFWINCDVVDFDGDNDNNLEDYYHLQISGDGGDTWTTLFYDYGDTNRPGGNGWEQYLPGMPFNGSYTDLRLNEWAGQEILIRWRLTTDFNDDGGTGSGLWIDDVEIWGSSVLANDLACVHIVPAYPRTAGLETPVYVEYANLGSEWRNQVQAWMVVNDQLAGPVLPRMDIAPLSSANRLFDWTPSLVGENELKSYANNNDDQNSANDTLWVSPIEVLPAGQLQFGYSYGDLNFYWMSGSPAMRVTLEDDYGQGSVRLTDVVVGLVAPEANFGGYVLRVHVMEDDGGAPGTELWSGDYTLTNQANTAVVWTLELGAELIVDSDFWVWVEPLSGYPYPLGDDIIWNTEHYALTDGETFNLNFSNATGRELHLFVLAEALESVAGPNGAAPAEFSLGAAYPNPFNPTTTLDFRAPAGQRATLAVFNLQGQRVATLFEGLASGQPQSAVFDAGRLASGVYLARLEGGPSVQVQKLVLVK
jgi:hypothetical protein